MYFNNIIGNALVKERLTHMVNKGATGNSLLFAGSEGIGKSLFALEFARMLIGKDDPTGIQRKKIELGTHPDVKEIKPSGKLGLHSMEVMRQFTEEVYLAPFEAKWKVFIIHDADRMLPYSANALLKTFEEPALDTLIILLSSDPKRLLPTILSRCRTIYFEAIPADDIARYLVANNQLSEEQAQAVSLQAQGSLSQAMRLLEEGNETAKTVLINALVVGKVSSYTELQKMTGEIGDAIEQIKKHVEETSKQELMQGFGDTLSAVQQNALERDIEGAISLRYAEEVDTLFATILGWYRDLHLLSVGGNPDLLIHRKYCEELVKALQKGGLLPLEDVQKAVSQAKLAIDRSSALNVCLESLFLKLRLLG